MNSEFVKQLKQASEIIDLNEFIKNVPTKLRQAAPDIAFIIEFLNPWFMGISYPEPNFDSLKSVKTHLQPSKIFHYETVNIDLWDEIDVALKRKQFPKIDFFVKSGLRSFARTLQGSINAGFGAGSSGQLTPGFIYEDTLPISLDVVEFSKIVVESCKYMFGSVPNLFELVDTYGTREGEVIAYQNANSIALEQVLAFKSQSLFFTIEELKDEQFDIIKFIDSRKGILSLQLTKNSFRSGINDLKHGLQMLKTGKMQIQYISWFLTGSRKNESSVKAKLVKEYPRDVPEPTFSKTLGHDVFLYHF